MATPSKLYISQKCKGLQGIKRQKEQTKGTDYNSCKKMLQNHALSPVATPVKLPQP